MKRDYVLPLALVAGLAILFGGIGILCGAEPRPALTDPAAAIPQPTYEVKEAAPTYSAKGDTLTVTTQKTVRPNNLPADAKSYWYLTPTVPVLPLHLVIQGGNVWVFPWGIGPVPPEPIPPVPPVPPDPEPPVPVAGLNVALIGPEPRVVRNLMAAQVAILSSRSLRNYIEQNCEKDDDGITPAYKVLIRQNDNDLLSPRWKTLLDRVPKEGCFLAAVKGTKYHVGPLPADVAAVGRILAEVSGVPFTMLPGREYPNLRIIPDGDWEKYNPPPLADGTKIAIVGGEKRFLSARPRDLTKQPRGKPLSAFGINLIPRDEWPARIAALKAANAGLMPLTYHIPPYDQNGTNYCWCNAPVQGVVAMAYQQGRPHYMLSAASVGGPITGYRNVGGWGLDAMNFLEKTGSVRSSLWPSNSISSSYFKKPEVQADYPRNRLTAQIADLGATGKMFDEVATCVLLGAPVPVGYNFWSHEVLGCGLEIKDGKPYLILRNSWGQYEDNGFFLLPEGPVQNRPGKNLATPDDAHAILSMMAA